MKRAVILHSYGQNSQGHWYPWLKRELQARGYKVWAPDMPTPDKPNARIVTDFLLGNNEWDFNDNLLVGHSWGAVQILHLLQNLPEGVRVKAAVPVSAYSHVLADEPDWEQLRGLFEEPFDFDKIKAVAQKILFVHGDDDPWCDPKQAEFLAEKSGAELVYIPGGQHFSTSLDPAYSQFPKLIELLESRSLL